jgi:hypothetical protein
MERRRFGAGVHSIVVALHPDQKNNPILHEET